MVLAISLGIKMVKNLQSVGSNIQRAESDTFLGSFPLPELYKYRLINRKINRSWEYENDTWIESWFIIDDDWSDMEGDCEDRSYKTLKALKEANVTDIYFIEQPGHACYGIRRKHALYLSYYCDEDEGIINVERVN